MRHVELKLSDAQSFSPVLFQFFSSEIRAEPKNSPLAWILQRPNRHQHVLTSVAQTSYALSEST